MKKIFIAFLSVLTIYHFLYSSVFSVYASEILDNTFTDQIDFENIEIPLIHDIPQTYSATLTVGSMAVGGATIMTAPFGLGAVLIGAALVAGVGFLMANSGNILSLDDYYSGNYTVEEIEEMVKELETSVNSDGSLTVKPSYSTNNIHTSIRNSTQKLYNKNLDKSGNTVFTEGSYSVTNNLEPSGFNFDRMYYSSYYSAYYMRFNFSSSGNCLVVPIFYALNLAPRGYLIIDGSYNGTFNLKESAYSSSYSEIGRMSDVSTSSMSFYDLNGNQLTIGTSSGIRESDLITKPFKGFMSNSKIPASSVLVGLGASILSASQTDKFIEQLKLQSQANQLTYTIPAEQIGVANPGLSFDGENWVNQEGEKVDPFDVISPLPNSLTNDKLTFDDTTQAELDKVINGSTTAPDDNVNGGVGDTSWLSSVLNAIMSLPSLIANAFSSLFETIVNAIESIPNAIGLFIDNVIIAVQSIPNALSGFFDNVVGAVQAIPNALSGVLGGISTGINNTWEWCKGLPNVLGELLGALGSAIVDGLTLAFSGVISGIQTIVDFFVGILDFVMSLVIPSDGFFSSELSKLGDVFNSKFPFFSQIGDILNAFKFDINAPLPEFKITVPIKFGGGTYNVINFAHFVSYRQYILNFIRLFTWIPFLIRIYKKSMYMATGK